MLQEALSITDQPGSQTRTTHSALAGPLILPNVFSFQITVRSDQSQTLILDFSKVPYADSAGIGALVGAYVTRQNSKRRLGLVWVCLAGARRSESHACGAVLPFLRFGRSGGTELKLVRTRDPQRSGVSGPTPPHRRFSLHARSLASLVKTRRFGMT